MFSRLVSRTDHSVFGQWWWTVDRWLLGALTLIILFGTLLIATASTSVAERIGLNGSHFLIKHIIYLIPAMLLIFGISLLTPRKVLLFAFALFCVGIVMMVLTLIIGTEVKGARRWVHIPFLSTIQPSEFVKPAFTILNAWLLAHPAVRSGRLARLIPCALLGLTVILLLLQPDLGMTILTTAIWMAQLFMAGVPIMLALGLGATAVTGVFAAYFIFPHVASRIDRFMNPAAGDTYQVDRAADAFQAGGLFGTGLGAGEAKNYIPDVHADFIFAVAGEEMGLLWCLVLLGLLLFFIMRGFWRTAQGPTLFVTLAGAGLVVQFAVQTLVNISSTLHLIPTKGMTLPFISYGGSSLLAMSIGMGMLLALTRKRSHIS